MSETKMRTVEEIEANRIASKRTPAEVCPEIETKTLCPDQGGEDE